MIVFSHPDHVLHDPVEKHRFGGELLPPAETARRAERILAGLRTGGDFDIRRPAEVDEPTLLLVHTARYLRFLETAHRRWRSSTGGPAGGEAVAYIRPLPGTRWRRSSHIDAELGIYSNDVDPILEGTWQAARSAASSAVAAAGAVWAGERAAYALSRPPGHHAAAEMFGGYCYLNNTALAAAWTAAQGARVAVLDVDTHHGNGTQTVFWERGDILTVSIHGDPELHYPYFLGYADERGGGDGSGANLNLPLPGGSGWDAYEPALERAAAAVESHRSEVLIVALGVDSHAAHGVLALQDGDYPAVGRSLAGLGLPTVFVQEGGYADGVLEHAVPAVLDGFTSSM